MGRKGPGRITMHDASTPQGGSAMVDDRETDLFNPIKTTVFKMGRVDDSCASVGRESLSSVAPIGGRGMAIIL